MSENVEQLTYKQRKGIEALLICSTIEEASLLINVNPKTLKRWMNKPEFKNELRKAHAKVVESASQRMTRGIDQALDTLEYLMKHARNESVKRVSASNWLDKSMKLREETDLEQRIAELEKKIK